MCSEAPVRGLKWRRAIAAVCALDLLGAAAVFFVRTSEGAFASGVLILPPLFVGGLAGWWAWRGWAIRPAPPAVVGALWAMAGTALAFTAVIVVMRPGNAGTAEQVGRVLFLVAPSGALLAGVLGFRWQRARVRAAARRVSPAASGARGPCPAPGRAPWT